MPKAFALLLVVVACTRASPASSTASAGAAVDARALRAAEALCLQAARLRAAGDDDGARGRLDEALAASPGYAPAALERAELLVAQGADLELARRDAERAAEALPESARALRVLGQMREEEGRLEDAVEAYGRALALQDDAVLRRRTAMLAARAGRVSLAIRLWEPMRDADPADVAARTELAVLYEKDDRPASAELALREAAALLPENPLPRRRLAEFLERQGKLEDARAARDEADELSPRRRAPRELRPLLPASR